ncbi:hypothetical protein B1B_11905 [mine drainage metagenome]|uniref:Uncharacterized protein n=1 Tax=mine drainage metagenome TaxID=410659 RepID=T1B375_9ZZZZ
MFFVLIMPGYRKYRSGPYRRGPNSNSGNQYDQTTERIKKLDMRKEEEFRFLLSKIIETLPDSVRGAIKGSVYSIASKKSTKEAKDYIMKKKEEGVIDSKTEKKLIDLVFDYSKYR